jgi:DNA-binding LacI/PurR family transcriptional regulator
VPRRSLVGAIYRGVLCKLASGEWSPPGLIPPSRLLAGEFACSQRVVQAALRRAAQAGLLTVRQRQATTILPDADTKARQLLDDLAPDKTEPLLAVLVPDRHLGNVGYNDLINWTTIEARRRGIGTKIVPWPAKQQLALVNRLMRRRTSAVFAVGFDATRYATLHVLHERGMPLVTHHRRLPELGVPSVSFDEYDSARRIVRHLASLGHRNMCLATIDGGWSGRTAELNTAWVDSLDELGLLDHCAMPLFVTYAAPRLPSFSRLFCDVMRSPNRPTAVLLGHISLLHDFLCGPAAGLRIPEDISLVVFDRPHKVPELHRRRDFSCIVVDVRRTAQCTIEIVEQMLAGDFHQPTIRVPMLFHLTDTIGVAAAGTSEAT